MASVELNCVVKSYGKGLEPTIKGIDLTIQDGEFFILLGPSGCGKSTLLRSIAGLEDLSSGEVHIGERRVDTLAPKARDIAMVFQSYALYPHMTVRRNLAFGLEMRRTPKAEITRRIDELAPVLGLEGLLDRLPKALSGGQRQRVALGRAIVREPKVFLLDEPLSNLDAKLRGAMRVELKRLHRRLGVTMVYVTHDQVEAMTLGDRVAVLHEGRLQQVGSPLEVYDSPANQFVASFLGSPPMNFLQATLEGTRARVGRVRLSLPPHLIGVASQGATMVLGVRPEDLELAPEGQGLECTVAVVEPLGAATLLTVDSDQGPLVARIAPGALPRLGERVFLRPGNHRLHMFDTTSGERIGPAPTAAPVMTTPELAEAFA